MAGILAKKHSVLAYPRMLIATCKKLKCDVLWQCENNLSKKQENFPDEINVPFPFDFGLQ